MGTLTFDVDINDLDEVKDYWRDKKPIDIVVCLDSSGSMAATDFQPNRFEAAKKAAKAFTLRKIAEHHKDRVSLLTFGGTAKVHIELTEDLDKVSKTIDSFGNQTITHTSTSFFNVIKSAVDVLAKGDSRPKAIILLTDGDDWGGQDPLNALGNKTIPIYTIGIGAAKSAAWQKDKFDEGLLKKIAKQSGGKYFHAPEVAELVGIFENLANL